MRLCCISLGNIGNIKQTLQCMIFGWLIFAFHFELKMLETMSGGPYLVFGQPLILKVMPEFFDFQNFDMTKLPT